MKQPIVKLVSHTPNPIEELFACEKFAKTNSDNPLLINPQTIAWVRQEVHLARNKDNDGLYIYPNGDLCIDECITGHTHTRVKYQDLIEAGFVKLDGAAPEHSWFNYVKEVESWALKVAGMAIPISEFIHFNFQFSNVTIAWREQLVRSRTNSYWIQSNRITNNEDIDKLEGFHTPDSIKKGDPKLLEEWLSAWSNTASSYHYLRSNGIPDEDCRELLGSGALHRLSASFNLRSLIQMLKHRTCWISQSHWGPIVMGMIRELMKIDPVFEILGRPPCWDQDKKFTSCKYQGICEERYEGSDPHPCCPLYIGQHHPGEVKSLESLGRWDSQRNKQFGQLWNKKEL